MITIDHYNNGVYNSSHKKDHFQTFVLTKGVAEKLE